MVIVMASTTEAELAQLFENCQKATSMWTTLKEMVQQQTPTPVATDNSAENIFVNGLVKQKGLDSLKWNFIRYMIKSDKNTYIYYGRRVRKIWLNTSQNTTAFGTIENFVQQC